MTSATVHRSPCASPTLQPKSCSRITGLPSATERAIITRPASRLRHRKSGDSMCLQTAGRTLKNQPEFAKSLLAWLARKRPTLGHLFPAIHGDSAQTKGTVLLSIVSSSYPRIG